MKKIFTFLISLSLVLSACSTQEALLSPSGEQSMESVVKENIVILELYDATNTKLGSVDTRASNSMKWAAGWDLDEDIIILNSKDIGIYAWTFSENTFQELEISTEHKQRAKDLFEQKYPSN